MKKIILIVSVLLLGGVFWWLIKVRIINTKTVLINSEVTKVVNNGVLKIGFDTTFYPMEYLDKKGVVSGFDKDFAMQIAKKFGVKLEEKVVSFDEIFKQLDEGKFDMVISSVTITTERSKVMSFSKPYLNAGQVIMVKTNDNLIKDKLSLGGKKIGVQRGTTSEIEALKLTDKNKVMSYSDYDVATSRLLSGEVEAIIVDYPVGAGKVKNNSNLKLVGEPFTQEFYGVVVAKGKENLLVPVNLVIESMITSGEMKKLENKWLK